LPEVLTLKLRLVVLEIDLVEVVVASPPFVPDSVVVLSFALSVVTPFSSFAVMTFVEQQNLQV
jgi:hypothetical protein